MRSVRLKTENEECMFFRGDVCREIRAGSGGNLGMTDDERRLAINVPTDGAYGSWSTDHRRQSALMTMLLWEHGSNRQHRILPERERKASLTLW
jgi:hypothetical protein